MEQIIFSTGNNRKVQEARAACTRFDIIVIQKELAIDEIQSHSPVDIAIHKAQEAYALLGAPVVINDSSWNIPALNGFPGGYMKDVNEWLETDDSLNLMNAKSDRRVCTTEHVVYRDSADTKIFTKAIWGEIATTAWGYGKGVEQVALYKGRAIGEYQQAGELIVPPEDDIWIDFANWFSALK